ncbi:BTAD domain-containing putative transcriptional regulator [Streptomyces sp. NPDC048290]|uniref:BTAD domain-containing putative transcriptional regulator n=1 Tax=Streptomyces sp. NPDC048290 TaxID=3155811 RepID=UPI0034134228
MRYRILGITEAQDPQGHPLPLPGPRIRTLLTALATHPGHPRTTTTLIDEIWPDNPPQDPPAALQALVARLRRAIGKDTVESTPGGYRLTADESDVDLFVFADLTRKGTAALAQGDPDTAARHLTTALALWRGPALADLPDRTAATRPEALRLAATRTRIAADLARGRAEHVVPELSELTTAHPYDETLHAHLVRALRDTGRPADALAAYERARRALADGLGTDPGPELCTLHTELLTSPTPEHPSRPQTPTRTGNIRPRLNSFVGRELELDALRSELHRARLVTLTGPGGSGKTRLAEEAAAAVPDAWLVELAPLDRPEAVPGAVVSALGLRETVLRTHDLGTSQDDPVALLIEHCAPRGQLLILDNCEHVIGAAAQLAETLLTHCPGLTVLATSREPLGVPGESVRPVEPLHPDQAHRLFAERASAARLDADALLRDQDTAVTEICRRLDGLPLAIELAAARLRMLTPRQIADRLDDRFRLLTAGSRTALPRQQTLRAVVDWSWDLLDEDERDTLREVSVFAGGWDLPAAEAVCATPRTAELLGALVDKSLIVASPHPQENGEDGEGDQGGNQIRNQIRNQIGKDIRKQIGKETRHRTGADRPTTPDVMRYRMLETIHEYAAERAAEHPAHRAATEARHLTWALALARKADPILRSSGQLPWIARLETELDNIRAALRYAIDGGREPEAGGLVLAMSWFWWLRNHRQEGVRWVEHALRLASPAPTPTVTPTVISTATPPDAFDVIDAYLAVADEETTHPQHAPRMDLRMTHLFFTSDLEPTRGRTDPRYVRYIDRLRDHYEKGGPASARMPGLLWAPLTAFHRRGAVDSRQVLETAVANCRSHGDDWELAVSLLFRTHLAVDSPGPARGVAEDLAELRALSRRVGDRWLRAQVCGAAGEAAIADGDLEEARRVIEEALPLAYEVGAYTEGPLLLVRLAEITYRRGDRVQGAALLDEATTAADRHGVPDSRAHIALLRSYMALQDGEVPAARAWSDKARAQAAVGTPPPPLTAALDGTDALITAEESGPAHGLAPLAEALATAVAQGCPERSLVGLVDSAAELLARLGDLPRAARLFGAADHLLGGLVRLPPERQRIERGIADIRTALGPPDHATHRARGARLTPDGILRELHEATRAHGPKDRPPTPPPAPGTPTPTRK